MRLPARPAEKALPKGACPPVPPLPKPTPPGAPAIAGAARLPAAAAAAAPPGSAPFAGAPKWSCATAESSPPARSPAGPDSVRGAVRAALALLPNVASASAASPGRSSPGVRAASPPAAAAGAGRAGEPGASARGAGCPSRARSSASLISSSSGATYNRLPAASEPARGAAAAAPQRTAGAAARAPCPAAPRRKRQSAGRPAARGRPAPARGRRCGAACAAPPPGRAARTRPHRLRRGRPCVWCLCRWRPAHADGLGGLRPAAAHSAGLERHAPWTRRCRRPRRRLSASAAALVRLPDWHQGPRRAPGLCCFPGRAGRPRALAVGGPQPVARRCRRRPPRQRQVPSCCLACVRL